MNTLTTLVATMVTSFSLYGLWVVFWHHVEKAEKDYIQFLINHERRLREIIEESNERINKHTRGE